MSNLSTAIPATSTWAPLTDRILVVPLITAELTAGGLIAPDSARDRPQSGMVLAVGPQVQGVHVDDLVLFGKYAGVAVPFERYGEILLMREAEALANRPPSDYRLIVHDVARGLGTQLVLHEDGTRCLHCAPEPPSPLLEDERQRLIARANQD